MLWDRGYWGRMATIREAGFKKGDLKFTLDGEKLHGSWVLVRMKHDRNGGKRTNWLLIKHRDEFASEGDGDGILDEDRSVASGRAMEQIAAGKGTGAKAVHAAPRRAPRPTRCGIPTQRARRATRRTTARKPRRRKTRQDAEPRARRKRGKTAPRDAGFRRAAALQARSSGRPAAPAGCMRSSSTAIACSCASRAARRVLNTRKGLDWTAEVPAHRASRRRRCPMRIIDGEIVALDHNGAPDFAALQAALSDGKTDDLIFFAFDLLFADGEDLRALPLSRAQGAAEAAARARKPAQDSLIRYVEHFETGGDAVLQSACQHVAGRHRLQEARRALSLRPHRQLDQGQMPRRP